MGWFDWLFGRKKKTPQVSTAAAPPKPSVPVPQAVDDPDEDWAEATTFISVRLSPIAQREIKNLRTLLGEGTAMYAWTGNPCGDCKKFLSSGPFRVGDGLTGQSPVPGREGCGGEKCDCTIEGQAG